MPNQRNLRGQPGHVPQLRPEEAARVVRPRPSEVAAAAAARTSRRIAIVAFVLALVAIGVAGWRFVFPASASAACQTAAWDVTPATADLPDGWTISTSQYGVGQKQMTLLGPAPQDTSSSQAVVYATITCYPQGAADSVTRSADAATAAGQVVTQRSDLGDQGFLASDDSSGAMFLQFRHGDVVVYLAASGDATSDEVDGIASAFDVSMGGDGAQAPVGTPDAGGASPSEDLSSPGASDQASPSESPAAPELESALPRKVGDITLTVESAIGASILGGDQGSRAITAALRAEGKKADDLRVAQAYDASGAADLSILAIRVQGMKLDALKSLVLDSWLTASGAGVKQDTVTLAGKTFTRIDYGDQGSKNYVLATGDMIRIIETADASVAAQAAAALP